MTYFVVFKTTLKDEGDLSYSGGGMKRSFSSPNIEKIGAEDEVTQIKPLPDRELKPKPQNIQYVHDP